MTINFHYFLIKVLASEAGFDAQCADDIAFYSQMIDDFNITWENGYIYVDAKPPEYFIERGLAGKSKFSLLGWWFYPATTGISVPKSLAPDYQTHTIAPFHFIPPRANVLEKSDSPERRCVCVEEYPECLAAQLMNEITPDNLDIMKLGMLIHTYSDTYAHEHFSGINGLESKSEVLIVENRTKQPSGGKYPDPMKPSEKTFAKILPSIGHANFVHIPDVLGFAFQSKHEIPVEFYEEGKKISSSIYNRYNMDRFMLCARRILDKLCSLSGKRLYNQDEWKILEARLRVAAAKAVHRSGETANINKLAEYWGSEFNNISFTYEPNSRFGLKVKGITKLDKKKLAAGGLKQSHLEDLFSKEGRKARESVTAIIEKPNEDFYKYNQIAYEHVKKVTGGYRNMEEVKLLLGKI